MTVAIQRNIGRGVSWRNGSLQRKLGLDLRLAVLVCPNVTGSTNDRIAQSKRARAGYARHNLNKNLNAPKPFDSLATSGAKLYPPGVSFVLFADADAFLSLALRFRPFCFH